MYEQLDLGFLLLKPRTRPFQQPDPQAVEPWDKTTLQLDIRDSPNKNNFKTFYQTAKHPFSSTGYATHRSFSFMKEKSHQNTNLQFYKRKLTSKISSDLSSKTNQVNQYNINGNFLPKDKFCSNSRFRRHLFLRQKKERPEKSSEYDKVQKTKIGSVFEIKKRLELEKQISMMNNSMPLKENPEMVYLSPYRIDKRKSKVIAVGFQKISTLQRLRKEKSLI